MMLFCCNWVIFIKVFADYLSETTGKAYKCKKSLSDKRNIALIHQFGAKAFLANVLQLENKNGFIIQNLKEVKFKWKTFISSIKKYNYSCFLKKLAQKHKLLFSGGSDFTASLRKMSIWDNMPRQKNKKNYQSRC